eukprot:Hpha_TRINITY_DN12945_c0_g1::TRINITY_DN12945_c0_g1_i2::g.164641::m.164641
MARFAIVVLVLAVAAAVAAASPLMCWAHSTWSECASACPLRCNQTAPDACVTVCVPDCVCETGYVRYWDSCVMPADCASLDVGSAAPSVASAAPTGSSGAGARTTLLLQCCVVSLLTLC